MATTNVNKPIRILLADDDKDDCLLFKEALAELEFLTELTIVRDGVHLMVTLRKIERLPDIVFLDLNMPRKNGFECLSEIKQDRRLKSIPVVVVSTSSQPEIIELVYKKGAQHYICKPNRFSKLVEVLRISLEEVLKYPRQGVGGAQPLFAAFVLPIKSE